MDTLLSAGYYLAEDIYEQKITKPYPALWMLDISVHLKARRFAETAPAGKGPCKRGVA